MELELDTNKIKLVIWDLDDTFWEGTLSEGPVTGISSNIQLVKDLTDRGIVNTICSKNDYEPAAKQLRDMGVLDYFVFNSIDWTPKGPRINKLIKDMGLRPVNCLFVDDNVVNLNEAIFYSKELMTIVPVELSKLELFCDKTPQTDINHLRLNQYKILERKEKAKCETGDNLKFLYSSNTRVLIHKDCVENIDRIFELINRTNQLNYTKHRCSRNELYELLNNADVDCGYVTVTDNFGDYGIVGFYALKGHALIHFLFSCRTIGQGVEQWVYSTLGCPDLKIAGDVVNNVDRCEPPKWINQEKKTIEDGKYKNNVKIVFKGACDLCIMASYLSSNIVFEEFTYIGKNGNIIEHHNHSVNYLSFHFLSEYQKQTLVNDCIFNDLKMFDTAMYDEDTSIIFLSTLIEPMLGIYENKENKLRIAFGDYIHPLTDKDHWEGYINGSYSCHQNIFTKEWLKMFSEKYIYIGRMSPEGYISQLDLLFMKIPPTAHVCLLLGSETPFYKEQLEGYESRHLYYREINNLVKKYASTNERLHLINFNDYIKSQDDFTNNINHFQRRIYYQAALKANDIIEMVTGKKLNTTNFLFAHLSFIKSKIGRSLNSHSILYRILSKFNEHLSKKK